ncbi:MAG: divergent polysaccharide deacetylase family protein [Thiohalophilus sp.]
MSSPKSVLLLPLLLVAAGTAFAGNERVAQTADKPQPVISIIIDDLGNQRRQGLRAVSLPGQLTYAILPHSPFTRLLANRAHRQNKEIMVHIPMEAENGKALGPGALLYDMKERHFKTAVRYNFDAVPHAIGFNNHMGSRLTASTSRMRWLMQAAMFRDDLYFIDSRTTPHSVALEQADQRKIRSTSRDIFLDYRDDEQVVAEQLTKLIEQARRNGTALAIGHPYPATLSVLEQWLPELARQGVRLVPVSRLIAIRQQRRESAWPMYSSRSPRAVKNSKP